MFRVMAMALVVAGGCATGSGSCGHTDETTYRCMPLIANMKGCVGGPRGGDAMTARVYPVGCQVDVAACSELDPAIPSTFECALGADGEPDWYEPI